MRNRRREKTNESGWLRDMRGSGWRGVGLICANGKWEWGHMAEEKGLSPSTERQGQRKRQDSRERFQDAGKGLERGEGRTKSRRKANEKKEEEDGRGRGIAEKTERTQKDQSWER